jgi:hypothetical protein
MSEGILDRDSHFEERLVSTGHTRFQSIEAGCVHGNARATRLEPRKAVDRRLCSANAAHAVLRPGTIEVDV